MRRIVDIILFRQKLVLLIIALLTLFLGFQIKNLRVNSDVIDSLPDNDPDAKLLKEIGAEFGGSRMGIIILESGNIYSNETLQELVVLTDSIAEIHGVQSVTSLANVMEIRGGEFGIEVGSLFDPYEIPENDSDLKNLKDRVSKNDRYRKTLVDDMGTATTLLFALEEDADIHDISTEVKRTVSEMEITGHIYYSGSPMLVSSISQLISRDMTRLIPITFVVIGLMLFIGFRSPIAVILPLFIAVIAIVWTMGMMGLFGVSMSMVSSNIPILLLAVGSAYSIHVVNRILLAKSQSEDINMAMSFIFIPVLLSAVTTAVGFSSFTFGAYLEMIRDYGVFTALGTIFSCILSLTLVPILMSKVKPPQKIGLEYFQSFLEKLSAIVLSKPRTVITFWVIFLIAGLAGIFLIKREIDIKDYFKRGNPNRMAEEIMASKFAGTKPVFVKFTADIQDPATLSTMLAVENHMKNSPDIETTQSIAGIVLELNSVLGNGNSIPKERAVIEQLWFLIDGNEYLDRLVSEDLDEAIILSTFISPDNESKIEFQKYMKDFLDSMNRSDLHIQMTGMPFVDITMDRSLVQSQFTSLIIAVLFVLILVSFILRSLVTGLQASAPILTTILILFGVMGFGGIPLNIGTVLVASVALGIGIDYSIHIINHFNSEIKMGKSKVESIENTLIISGNAVIINMLSVACGFMVLIFSEMVPLQYFGMLVATSMLGSGLGSLTLLPAILIISKK